MPPPVLSKIRKSEPQTRCFLPDLFTRQAGQSLQSSISLEGRLLQRRGSRVQALLSDQISLFCPFFMSTCAPSINQITRPLIKLYSLLRQRDADFTRLTNCPRRRCLLKRVAGNSWSLRAARTRQLRGEYRPNMKSLWCCALSLFLHLETELVNKFAS